jgi:hypothetical protein
MTGALLAALLAATLPEGSARWRFEMSGEHVGVVELAIRCGGGTCTARYASDRRAPADAGGKRSARRVEIEVDAEGRWQGGRLRVTDEDGGLKVDGVAGAIPALLAEVVLARTVVIPPRKGWQSSLPPGPETCLDAFDEITGQRGTACAARDGDALAATVLGVRERIVPGPGGFPADVEVPGQAARFIRDDQATTPRQAPRLHGMVVAGPEDPSRASSFCAVPRDPDPPAWDVAFLPAPRADGVTCREKTAAWLARAARGGVRGRSAVGVAWDGARFVWHAWAEVRLARGWIAVDPSFGELPARSPRFTVATWDDADPAARQRAGERVLACWGRERVR